MHVDRHTKLIQAQILKRIAGLRNELIDLRLDSFPSKTSLQLIDVLLNVVNFIEGQVDATGALSVFSHSSAIEVTKALLIQDKILVEVSSRFLEAINGSKSDKNNWAVVSSFEKLSKEIFRRTQVLIHPSYDNNYSYEDLMRTLEELVTSVNNSFSDQSSVALSAYLATPYLIDITYPITDNLNTLNSVILGHELGHFVDEVNKLSERVFENFVDDLGSNIDWLAIKADLGIDGTDAKSEVKFYLRAVGNWLKEIISDFSATLMFGPAWIFAFEQVVMATETPMPSHLISSRNRSIKYPPSNFRMKLMVDFFQDWFPNYRENLLTGANSDVRDLIIDSLKEFDLLASDAQNSLTDELSGIAQFARRQLIKLLPEITESFRTISHNTWMMTEKDLELSGKLVHYLSERLPPFDVINLCNPENHAAHPEKVIVPRMQSVLCAAWLFAIEGSKNRSWLSNGNMQGITKGNHVLLDNLISKALEACSIAHIQDEHRFRN